MSAGNRAPDRESFEAFSAAARDDLVRTAARIVRDPGEAEDVVQDTLAAMWRRWARHPPARPAAYAARAVTLNAIKRRTRRRPVVPLEHDAPAAAEAPEPEWGHLGPMELERALAALPPAQQAVVRLRYYLGLSLAEVGRRLSISSDTAASRCRYALATLRRTLAAAPGRAGASGNRPDMADKENRHGKP